MNKQIAPNGIEWTRVRRWNAMFGDYDPPLDGYTWNPTGGCFHGCAWGMPDGSTIECYAKTVAEQLAAAQYQDGFAHHYWRPYKLDEPTSLRKPSGIFVGSMADIFGKWVQHEQLITILDVMRAASWHTFLLLTKNPMRIVDYIMPDNIWAGCSIASGRSRKIDRASATTSMYLAQMRLAIATVRFVSFEPLWFDVAPVLENHLSMWGSLPFEWAIVGAASNGSKTYQPRPEWVEGLLAVLDRHEIPVFMKNNLEYPIRREEFPRKG